jgi:hypothetical protein
MFRALSCPSSGEWYKIDNAYGVQHWPCCRRLVEKRWFGVHLLGMVSRLTNFTNFNHAQCNSLMMDTQYPKHVREEMTTVCFMF